MEEIEFKTIILHNRFWGHTLKMSAKIAVVSFGEFVRSCTEISSDAFFVLGSQYCRASRPECDGFLAQCPFDDQHILVNDNNFESVNTMGAELVVTTPFGPPGPLMDFISSTGKCYIVVTAKEHVEVYRKKAQANPWLLLMTPSEMIRRVQQATSRKYQQIAHEKRAERAIEELESKRRKPLPVDFVTDFTARIAGMKLREQHSLLGDIETRGLRTGVSITLQRTPTVSMYELREGMVCLVPSTVFGKDDEDATRFVPESVSRWANIMRTDDDPSRYLGNPNALAIVLGHYGRSFGHLDRTYDMTSAYEDVRVQVHYTPKIMIMSCILLAACKILARARANKTHDLLVSWTGNAGTDGQEKFCVPRDTDVGVTNFTTSQVHMIPSMVNDPESIPIYWERIMELIEAVPKSDTRTRVTLLDLPKFNFVSDVVAVAAERLETMERERAHPPVDFSEFGPAASSWAPSPGPRF